MNSNHLRDHLAVTGGKITDRDQEQMKSWIGSNDSLDEKSVDIYSVPMECFLFETVIRPIDNGLVIHLKHLPPALRNPKFFEYATMFIRDRVGKFKTLKCSFIGELDSANKLNSLDLMFTDYFPATRGDFEFIKKHCTRIGKELDDDLCRQLGELALETKRR